MQECWVSALYAERKSIRRQWETLLRLEDGDTPIAAPDCLVHLIDWTLDEIFDELRRKRASHASAPGSPAAAMATSDCRCGHNPLTKHFLAGEQALLESLVLLQAKAASIDPGRRATAVARLYVAVHAVARREVRAFCGVCARPRASGDPTRPTRRAVTADSVPPRWVDALPEGGRRLPGHATKHSVELRERLEARLEGRLAHALVRV